METIRSGQNPKIKKLLELQAKSKARRESGLFVVEGVREIEHCLEAGFEADTIFHCPEILPQLPSWVPSAAHIEEVSAAVYAKVAYREGTEGLIAEIRERKLTLDDLDCKLGKAPLIMVLESVEKPGNLGAVLRSADAAGADAVFICDPLTDIYNPNLIRASIGAVFTVPVIACSSEDAISWLRKRGFAILTAQLQDSSLYYESDMKGATAIVMGTESTGLSDLWRRAATAHIRIPMLGRLDSLNVSVSAAILLFEAIRQRQ
ncbi:MAG: RNA methyltransferase [Bacteroidales bacterium]|nr:RNA methyltransferase [Bacteroidales bacterium]